jgi:hypothetical protein
MSLGIAPCIASQRLSAVAMTDDLLFTPEELEHLETCHDCLERWTEYIAESGRLLEEEDWKN